MTARRGRGAVPDRAAAEPAGGRPRTGLYHELFAPTVNAVSDFLLEG